MRDAAAGDIAISRALDRHLQRWKKPNIAQSANGTDSPFSLPLTSMETLLLSVVCSQGLPVWTDQWEHIISKKRVLAGAAPPARK